MSRLIPILQAMWRRMPVSRSLRATVGPLLWHVVTRRGRDNLKRTSDAAMVEPGPIIISANISDLTGIGRAGRLTLAAAGTWGVPILPHDIPADPRALQVPRDLAPGGVWLAHCNPPEAMALLSQDTEHLWATRYRIGYWAYELGQVPRLWAEAIPFFHEIWTPSSFVAEAVERARGNAGTIIRVVPHPVAIERVPPVEREGNGPLTFLVMVDARSSLSRKNPIGAVGAFKRAFTPEDAGVRLLVKLVAAWKDPRGVHGLREAAIGRPNIQFVEDELSDAETQRLLASADCLVSLHRAEGFGLPIAEAMRAGLPVIATDWSGNTDITRGATYEVPYRLIPARDATGRYNGTGQLWADPDISVAAELMRQVREDPAGRAAMASRGRQRVLELCSGLPFQAVSRFVASTPADVSHNHRPAPEDDPE